MALKSIQYRTQGTCCGLMNVVLDENKIYDIEFIGGCPGNLKGIRELLKGMDIDSVIEKFQGITCGAKSTSCPDQLAKCLIEFKKHSDNSLVK